MAQTASGLVRAYVELAHGMAQHAPDVIDAYYGPPAWAQAAPRSLADLAADADGLQERLVELEDENRRAYLGGQVRAMRTTLGLLMGHELPFREEVERLYDVVPDVVPESALAAWRGGLAELLPGEGDLAARLAALQQQERVPEDAVRPVLDAILGELRNRTKARFPLPDGEHVELRLVRDKPWSGYNTYLGSFTSRVEVNLDLPQQLHALPDLVAHEAYPGHHAEQAIKERELVGERGRLEHTLLLLNAPSATVSEAIAESALGQVLPETELQAWLSRELAPLAGVPADAAVRARAAFELRQRLWRAVMGNAALLLFDEGASDDAVLGYVQEQALASRQEAEHVLRFLHAPRSGSYVFTYAGGRGLLERLFARGDAAAWFARLLAEPATPADIRAWIEAGAPGAGPAEGPADTAAAGAADGVPTAVDGAGAEPSRVGHAPAAPAEPPAAAAREPSVPSPRSRRSETRDLTPLLADLEVELGGTLGVVARPLGAPAAEEAASAVAYRADEPFPAASTIKVFVLQALLERVAGGELDLDEALVLGSSDQVTGSGVLKSLTAGRAHSLRDLATLMIIVSDNTATNMLIQRLGIQRVNDVTHAHGWTGTELVGLLQRPDLRAPGDTRVSTASPHDLADYFARLWAGDLLPEALTRLAQSIYRRQQLTAQLGRYLPYDPDSAEAGEGPVIASKSGSLRGVRNEAGVVETAAGAYVLAIMSRDCPDRRFHLDNRGSLVVSKVSRLLFQRFAAS